MGANEISLVDTPGRANPRQVRETIAALHALDLDVNLAAHFHETHGLGLANCLAAYEAGIRTFDTAIGGLIGAPFRGAGNGGRLLERPHRGSGSSVQRNRHQHRLQPRRHRRNGPVRARPCRSRPARAPVQGPGRVQVFQLPGSLETKITLEKN